jgi:hypothetical protein
VDDNFQFFFVVPTNNHRVLAIKQNFFPAAAEGFHHKGQQEKYT